MTSRFSPPASADFPPAAALGTPRDWLWRGWQVRYTTLRPPSPHASSTPLIFVHGFGGSIGHWRNNLLPLSQHHPVYALDLLGFGASEKAPVRYSVELWAEQVLAFWRAIVGRPAIWVGHSIGSLVSVVAAARCPAAARGVVAITLPDPGLRRQLIPAAARPLVGAVERAFALPALLKPLFYAVRSPKRLGRWAQFAYSNPQVVDAELVDVFSTPAYDRGASGSFCRLFRASTELSFCPDMTQTLRQLSCPGLLMWGRDDRMVPPTLARPEQFRQVQPNLELLELAPGGHCLHDEQADRVNAAILDWIEVRAIDGRD